MNIKDLIRQGSRIGKLLSYQSPFWDSEIKQMKMGEAALMMAVITTAIEDLPLLLSKNEDEQREGREARFFIFSNGLKAYANLIELDPKYIREKIKAWMGKVAIPEEGD